MALPFSSFSLFIPFNTFKSPHFLPSSASTTRIMMSVQQPLPPLSDDRNVVGCGGASMDYLMMVDGFPKPDEKIQGSASKPLLKLEAPEVGALVGRLLVGTAERIPQLELVDTTGAGDAFIGAVLYALCKDMSPEKMLPFAATVAASCCRAFGARTGLPLRTDPCLQRFPDDQGWNT